MCDVPSIAVFCSESIQGFPGIASKFFLMLLVTLFFFFFFFFFFLLLLLLLLPEVVLDEDNFLAKADVRDSWTELHAEEFNHLFSSPINIGLTK
jgi:hypothetical protein